MQNDIFMIKVTSIIGTSFQKRLIFTATKTHRSALCVTQFRVIVPLVLAEEK